MNILDINKVKNNDYIVLLPECDFDIKESVEYSFDNVFYLDYEMTSEQAKVLIDFINNKSKQLLVFDYHESYRMILPYIRKNKKVKWIYKSNLALLTDGNVRSTFNSLMEFYDRNIVDTIGCLDYSTYEVLRNNGYNAKYITLDIKKGALKNSKSKSIGLIGDDYNPNHNTYNQLSSLKLVNYSYVKVIKNIPATNHFIEFFDIKEKQVDSYDKVIKDNMVNLYCNFTGNNYESILRSMDLGIPCILGNTDLFDKYPKLKKYLVLESDDDISEIASKINDAIENKEKILEEYNKFRKVFSEISIKSINGFLK